MLRAGRGVVLSFGLLGLLTAQDPPDLNVGVFPASNPWNWDITSLPVHPGSAIYIAAIGSNKHIQEDYAFPYSVVTGAQANVTVTFDQYPDESDYGNDAFGSNNPGGSATGEYPIPAGAPIEPGGDAHVLVVDTGTSLLYETYATSGGPPWTAGCGAVFNLATNQMRPEGWTSSDAAGLAILPGLIRYDEAVTKPGPINHAFRFTAPSTQNRNIYPARHHAGQANINLPPMGLRLRLKASKDLSTYSGAALKILEALKKHGMILADNGSSGSVTFISTTLDSRWGATTIMDIRDMIGSDFEVVQTVDAAGVPRLPVSGGGSGPPPPPDPVAGGGGGGGCGSCGLEGLLVLALLRAARRRA